ncbi:MAG TPA: hypothetical protein DHW02_20435 [Ktedonobacter sp.]|nr:hypothetical protein [Ktedonobacter sp.]
MAEQIKNVIYRILPNFAHFRKCKLFCKICKFSQIFALDLSVRMTLEAILLVAIASLEDKLSECTEERKCLMSEMTAFVKELDTIAQLIEQERQRGIFLTPEMLAERRAEIKRIDLLLEKLSEKWWEQKNTVQRPIEEKLHNFKTLLRQLTFVPSTKYVKRAKSLLAIKNLCFLEMDVYVDEKSGEYAPIRVLVLDNTGAVLLDRFIKPRYSKGISKRASYETGITARDIKDALEMPQVWNELLSVLSGKYIVSFDLLPHSLELEATAHYYQLEAPVFIGESLKAQCCAYFRYYSRYGWNHHFNDSLEQYCKSLGCPLPETPGQTAYDRALGLLHMLQAMAQGFFDESEIDTQFSSSTTGDEIDDMEFERDDENEEMY